MTDPALVLRTAAHLLSTTPETEIASKATHLHALLSTPSSLTTCLASSASSTTLLTNKLKSRISTLLNSKQVPSRYTGAVCAHAAFISSPPALQAWGPVWVKQLVPLISRPTEPRATVVIVARTLVKVFCELANGNAQLKRECVTPYVPPTIGALVEKAHGAEEDDETLVEVLDAIRDLVEAHPVTARPFVGKIKAAVRGILGERRSEDAHAAAAEVWVALHLCAKSPAQEWADMIATVIAATHGGFNAEFAVVDEDQDYRSYQQNSGSELAGVSPRTLLELLEAFFTSPTAASPTIPLLQVFTLAARILSITPSSPSPPSVDRATRDLFLTTLTGLHHAALSLLTTIVNRLTILVIPLLPQFLTHIPLPVCPESESLLLAILPLCGPTLQEPALSTSISPLCSSPSISSKLAATALQYLPQSAKPLRKRLERVVAQRGDVECLVTAVMWPREDGASLVAHLARAQVDESTRVLKEAVLRPRMPVVWTGEMWAENQRGRLEEIVDDATRDKIEQGRDGEEDTIMADDPMEPTPPVQGSPIRIPEPRREPTPHQLPPQLLSQSEQPTVEGESHDAILVHTHPERAKAEGEETQDTIRIHSQPGEPKTESEEAQDTTRVRAKTELSTAEVDEMQNPIQVSAQPDPDMVRAGSSPQPATEKREKLSLEEVIATKSWQTVGEDEDEDMLEIPEIVVDDSSDDEEGIE